MTPHREKVIRRSFEQNPATTKAEDDMVYLLNRINNKSIEIAHLKHKVKDLKQTISDILQREEKRLIRRQRLKDLHLNK